jgi:hypothetical protein
MPFVPLPVIHSPLRDTQLAVPQLAVPQSGLSRHSNTEQSISVACRIVLWADNETSSFLCTLVNGFNDVYQLLLVLQYPIQFVVIAGAEIAHHVFISEEEHEGDCVVKFFKTSISLILEATS